MKKTSAVSMPILPKALQDEVAQEIAKPEKHTISESGVASIQQMQKELIAIANETSKSSGSALVGPEFMKYIVGKSNATESPEKIQEAFIQIMNKMRDIGHAGTNAADGIWGLRTNDALNGMYDFTRSLLEIVKLKQNAGITYTDQDLAQFRALFPVNDTLSQQEKEKNAPAITEELQKIHTLYNQVAEKNQYKAPENKTVPTQDHVSSQIINNLKTSYPAGIANVRQVSVGIDDLIDKSAFDAWLEKNKSQLQPNDTPFAILESLLSQVRGK